MSRSRNLSLVGIATSLVVGLLALHMGVADASGAAQGQEVPLSSKPYTAKKKQQVRTEIKRLFHHGYNSYMKHAFPMDELKPLSCKGTDDFGGYSLTLIDTLDTLALMGEEVEFMTQVHYIEENIQFHDPKSKVVSVFETTIRVIGGLISSHIIAEKMVNDYKAAYAPGPIPFSIKTRVSGKTVVNAQEIFKYDGGLLRLAVSLADRLITAFDSPTGIPYNEINLKTGVNRDAGHTRPCPAGAGTLLLEFSALAALTGNCTYYTLAHRSFMGIWKHRSRHNLVGTMIDIFNGKWNNNEATIGASVDSFYEYLFKGYVTLGSEKYYQAWLTGYRAVQRYMHWDGWYLSSSMDHRGPLDQEQRFNSLQMFWPGLQVIAGDVTGALQSFEKMHCITRHHGLPPEYCHLDQFLRGAPEGKRTGPGYPLRPEFIESTYFLHQATRDDLFLSVGEEFLRQLKRTERPCGFAAVLDVYSWSAEDKMDSFVLAETFKYLYLLFGDDAQATGSILYSKKEQERKWDIGNRTEAQRRRRSGDGPPLSEAEKVQRHMQDSLFAKDGSWVVNTEAHPLPLSLDLQRVEAQCLGKAEGLTMTTQENDPSKIQENFTYHAAHEYESFETRHEMSDKKQCPKVDYFRDIAPALDHIRNHGRRCRMFPVTRIDHASKKEREKETTIPHHHPDGNAQPPIGSTGSANPEWQQKVVNLDVRVPKDPLDPEGRTLLFTLTAPDRATSRIKIDNYHGVTRLTNIALPQQALILSGSSGLHTRPVEFHPEQVNTLQYLSSESIVPGPTKVAEIYAQIASAQFGAAVCAAARVYPNQHLIDEKTKSFAGIVMDAQSDMCPKQPQPGYPAADSAAARSGGHGSEPLTPWETGDMKRPLDPRSTVGQYFGLLVQRGGCTFKEKTLMAQSYGANFVIVMNNVEGDVTNVMSDVPLEGALGQQPVRIPTVMISKESGLKLQAAIRALKKNSRERAKEQHTALEVDPLEDAGGATIDLGSEGLDTSEAADGSATGGSKFITAMARRYLGLHFDCPESAEQQFEMSWKIKMDVRNELKHQGSSMLRATPGTTNTDDQGSNALDTPPVYLYPPRLHPVSQLLEYKVQLEPMLEKASQHMGTSNDQGLRARASPRGVRGNYFPFFDLDGIDGRTIGGKLVKNSQTVCRHCTLVVQITELSAPTPSYPHPQGGSYLMFSSTTHRLLATLSQNQEEFERNFGTGENLPQGAKVVKQPHYVQREFANFSPPRYFSHYANEGARLPNGDPLPIEIEKPAQGGSPEKLSWAVAEVRTFTMDPRVHTADSTLHTSYGEHITQIFEDQHFWFTDDAMKRAGIVARYVGQYDKRPGPAGEGETTDSQAAGSIASGSTRRVSVPGAEAVAAPVEYVEILIFESEAKQQEYRNDKFEETNFHEGHLLQEQRSFFEATEGADIDVFDTVSVVKL